jgi:hypothetical protein
MPVQGLLLAESQIHSPLWAGVQTKSAQECPCDGMIHMLSVDFARLQHSLATFGAQMFSLCDAKAMPAPALTLKFQLACSAAIVHVSFYIVAITVCVWYHGE